ncbi:dephospho-CoA kinase [Oligoflexaceae bacterium]|nr:dephospho-CoA kinase [Oligoflexaceae bacterium]
MSSNDRDFARIMRRCGIGLTGGTATGKTTVGTHLRDLGYLVIDADKLARQAVKQQSKGLAQVVSEFGGSILKESGELNRKKLGQIIFNDESAKKKLESIIHPIIHRKLAKKIETAGLWENPRYWFYEAALLYETGYAARLLQIWAVHCSIETQLKRIVSRDKVSMEHAQKIIDAQLSNKIKTQKADIVIDTSTSIEELDAKIRVAIEYLPPLNSDSLL